MISLETAARLKEAGLKWVPALHDFFAIPDRGLDDRVFVLSDMTVGVEILHGFPAITFNGAVEWSLDFIYQFDVIWMPREDQLRAILTTRLAGAPEPAVQLSAAAGGCRCAIPVNGEQVSFAAEDAAEAYGRALLHLLQNPPGG